MTDLQPSSPMVAGLHHVEVWVADLDACLDGWRWLFVSLGWTEYQRWPAGISWRAGDGTYVVLEQSPDLTGRAHDRCAPGLNHLALHVASPALLARLRAEAPGRGWTELFADRFPHAGGPDHTALYLENAQGFEVELVAP